MSLILPSYQSGFAPRDYEPAYPSLWQGCVGAWAPLLGPTGLVLRDAVGKNDGVLTNGPTWQISGGKYALGFDGSNDYVAVPDSAAMNFGTNDFTVSGWFYVVNAAIIGSAFFAENNPGANQSQWWFRQENTSGAVRFLTESSTGATSVQSQDGALAANTWTHFCCRRLGQEVAIYKNGRLLASASGTVRNVSSSQNFVIGKQSNSYLQGMADDIRLYNRALSESEIRLLASRRGIGYDYRTHRSYSKTQSSGLLKRLILTGQT